MKAERDDAIARLQAERSSPWNKFSVEDIEKAINDHRAKRIAGDVQLVDTADGFASVMDPESSLPGSGISESDMQRITKRIADHIIGPHQPTCHSYTQETGQADDDLPQPTIIEKP